MIDTHCHLEMAAFDADREAVIARARDAGLDAVITVGSDLEGSVRCMELSARHDLVYAAVGLHPHDAKDFTESTCAILRGWIQGDTPPSSPTVVAGAAASFRSTVSAKIVAIGETGLDYHYNLSPREIQRSAFTAQLALAKETDLPAIIHSRDAKEDTLSLLAESGIRRGVMHCFSGDREMAERAVRMGLHISFAGPITFKNAGSLRDIAKIVPDDFLLVETDAPYLTPVPLRGKRNEPAHIVHIAEALAMLRGVSAEDIDRITTLNARRLFGIGPLPRAEVAYRIRDSLYLNITNRCTSRCRFCVRFHTDYVKGHNLRLEGEPTEEELKEAIGDPSLYKEVVFCGYGEPLLRLTLVKSLASWIKQRGGRVRINTNGHANMIHRRNILPELAGIVDSLSVSLNAPDEETYQKVCRPAFDHSFEEVVAFIGDAKNYIPSVQATVVDFEEVDVARCRQLTEELGIPLRVRKLDLVG